MSAKTLISRPRSRFVSANVKSLAVALCLLPAASIAAAPFTLNDVIAQARTMAASAQKVPDNELSKELLDLDYDQYRDIRFRSDHAIWRNARLPFELMFFHPGFHYQRAVRVHEITPTGVRDIPFSREQFDYGKNNIDVSKLRAPGFAGFRVHYALNTPGYKDEVVAFLGASYFRALGKGQVYGISARGLAVDTALGSGEEFPAFTEFWIERPAPAATQLTIYALLDSRRVTGAYRFVVKPGVETSMEVSARVFLREQVSKIGIAPLTSMYFFAENQPNPAIGDFRPEVHDSDGLSIHSGTGEWIWRPLVNPKRLLVSSFTLTNPIGFGLMQRDRRFSHYEDLESHFDKRPSVWVQPVGQWGAGRVELVQIPTPDETNDNIVAYWVPATLPPPKEMLSFDYRLLWQMDSAERPPQSWVSQTRRGHAYRKNPDDSIDFVIDFEGPAFMKLLPEAKVEPVVTGQNAEVREAIAYPNEVTNGYRLAVRVKRQDEAKPMELRAFLRATESGAISETWSYLLPPN